jgi:hypothetical protein
MRGQDGDRDRVTRRVVRVMTGDEGNEGNDEGDTVGSKLNVHMILVVLGMLTLCPLMAVTFGMGTNDSGFWNWRIIDFIYFPPLHPGIPKPAQTVTLFDSGAIYANDSYDGTTVVVSPESIDTNSVMIYCVEVLQTGTATRTVFVSMLFCHTIYCTRSVNVYFISETIVENASLKVVTAPPSVGYYRVAETCTPEPGGSMMCNRVVWDSTTSINFTEIEVAQPIMLTVNDPAMLLGTNNTTSSSHSKGITITLLVSLATIILT